MNMVCPKYIRETEGGRTFTVRTIKDWNTLDVSLHKQKSITSFKRSFYNQILTEQKSANVFRNCLDGWDVIIFLNGSFRLA